MNGDFSVDPRRCWIHGLSRVQHFSTPTPSGTTAGGVSWWECPQCNLAAVAPPSAPPAVKCPNPHCVNGRVGNVGCAVCKGEPVRSVLHTPAQHYPVAPPETTAPTATDVESLIAEMQKRAAAVPIGASFRGGSLHDGAIYGAYEFAIKLVRECAPVASSATPTPHHPTLGESTALDRWDGSTPLIDWNEWQAALASSQQEVERLKTENAAMKEIVDAAELVSDKFLAYRRALTTEPR